MPWGLDEVLVVLGKAAVAAKPGEGPFHDPSARQHDEALHVVAAFDDLKAQSGHDRDRRIDLAGMVTAVGPDEPW